MIRMNGLKIKRKKLTICRRVPTIPHDCKTCNFTRERTRRAAKCKKLKISLFFNFQMQKFVSSSCPRHRDCLTPYGYYPLDNSIGFGRKPIESLDSDLSAG